MDEQVDIVDETGKVLYQAGKHDAHRQGLLHTTVIGYLCDRNGDWILVKQSASRQDPGQWVGIVGGHVRAGESEDDALLREIEEEIGARNVTHNRIGRKRFHRQVIGRDENHLFVVYEFFTPDSLTLGHEGVATKRFTLAQMTSELAKRPEIFGDALFFVVESFYPHLLPDGWVRRFA